MIIRFQCSSLKEESEKIWSSISQWVVDSHYVASSSLFKSIDKIKGSLLKCICLCLLFDEEALDLFNLQLCIQESGLQNRFCCYGPSLISDS